MGAAKTIQDSLEFFFSSFLQGNSETEFDQISKEHLGIIGATTSSRVSIPLESSYGQLSRRVGKNFIF